MPVGMVCHGVVRPETYWPSPLTKRRVTIFSAFFRHSSWGTETTNLPRAWPSFNLSRASLARTNSYALSIQPFTWVCEKNAINSWFRKMLKHETSRLVVSSTRSKVRLCIARKGASSKEKYHVSFNFKLKLDFEFQKWTKDVVCKGYKNRSKWLRVHG